MIKDEIRKATNLVSQFHIENTNALLQKDGKCSEEYMASVTVRRIDQSTSVSSGSKTTTDEEDKEIMKAKEEGDKRRRIEKGKADQRRSE